MNIAQAFHCPFLFLCCYSMYILLPLVIMCHFSGNKIKHLYKRGFSFTYPLWVSAGLHAFQGYLITCVTFLFLDKAHDGMGSTHVYILHAFLYLHACLCRKAICIFPFSNNVEMHCFFIQHFSTLPQIDKN